MTDPVWQHPDGYETAIDAYVARRAAMLGIPPHLVPRPDGVQLDALGAAGRRPERVDFAALNRAAAQEMQRRQMRAYGDSLARAQPLTAQDFADVVGEQVARDEAELGSGGPWVEIGRERYPSERWERIPVDRVRYPGLADTRRVRRFHFETPVYRRQFWNVNWAVAAALIVVPAVSMLLSGEPLHMLAALIIGWSQALIGAVRMAVFSLRRRHTA